MSRGSTRRPRPAGRRRGKGGVNWGLIIGAVAALAIVGALAMSLSRQLISIEGVQSYGPFAANQHTTETVAYAQIPPVGGQHSPSWQNCGIYEVAIRNETAVHALEHGAVWLTYRPDLAADQVELLRSAVRGQSYTLLSPHAEQSAPVVASAWGLQLVLDRADDPRLGQFVTKYRQGPQTPEPGAACIGGVGSPSER